MTDSAGAYIIDDLRNPNDRNWVYFTDTVMGGVSKGKLEFRQDKDESHAVGLGGDRPDGDQGGQGNRRAGTRPLPRAARWRARPSGTWRALVWCGTRTSRWRSRGTLAAT